MSVFSKAGNRGHEVVVSQDEARQQISEMTPETKVQFVAANPKRAGSKAAARWEAYSKAKTIAQYVELGGTGGDAQYDLMRGFMKVVK